MIAIEINGEVKTFSKVPSSWSDENGLHLNITSPEILGFKEVVYPKYNSKVEELANLHLEGDVYTYDVVDKLVSKTIEELKTKLIGSLQELIEDKLSKTDKYVIRQCDTEEPMPKSIKEERAELRKQYKKLKAQINELTDKRSLVLFDIRNHIL